MCLGTVFVNNVSMDVKKGWISSIEISWGAKFWHRDWCWLKELPYFLQMKKSCWKPWFYSSVWVQTTKVTKSCKSFIEDTIHIENAISSEICYRLRCIVTYLIIKMIMEKSVKYVKTWGRGSLYPLVEVNWAFIALLSASEGFPMPGIPAWINPCCKLCNWMWIISGEKPGPDEPPAREWRSCNQIAREDSRLTNYAQRSWI